MSRSGYSEDCDDPWALIRWRGAVASAIRGKRGQALLRDLVATLDAMTEKKLAANSFETADGAFCTLGVIGHKRGIRMDDLIEDYEYCEVNHALLAERLGVASAMLQEIMWLNDEHAFYDETPEGRYRRMRKWVIDQIAAHDKGGDSGE